MSIVWQEGADEIRSITCFVYDPLVQSPDQADHHTFFQGAESDRLQGWHAWFVATRQGADSPPPFFRENMLNTHFSHA